MDTTEPTLTERMASIERPLNYDLRSPTYEAWDVLRDALTQIAHDRHLSDDALDAITTWLDKSSAAIARDVARREAARNAAQKQIEHNELIDGALKTAQKRLGALLASLKPVPQPNSSFFYSGKPTPEQEPGTVYTGWARLDDGGPTCAFGCANRAKYAYAAHTGRVYAACGTHASYALRGLAIRALIDAGMLPDGASYQPKRGRRVGAMRENDATLLTLKEKGL